MFVALRRCSMGSKIEMFWLVWLKLSTQRSLLVRPIPKNHLWHDDLS